MLKDTPCQRRSAIGLLMACWAATVACAAPESYNIIVACEMTAAGRKLVHPTVQHPAYYTSHLSGFTDWGKQWGLKDEETVVPPTAEAVGELVTRTLAEQGYLPALVPASTGPKAKTHPAALVAVAEPALIFNIYWGYIADPPIWFHQKVQLDGSIMRTTMPPSQRMLQLIGAPDTIDNARLGFSQDAGLNRYYVIIDAYDYAAFRQSHKKVMLWRTKMSVPSFNHTLTGTLQPMLAAGGPQFGRDLALPVNTVATETPTGEVHVGQPVVVGPAGKPAAESH